MKKELTPIIAAMLGLVFTFAAIANMGTKLELLFQGLAIISILWIALMVIAWPSEHTCALPPEEENSSTNNTGGYIASFIVLCAIFGFTTTIAIIVVTVAVSAALAGVYILASSAIKKVTSHA